MLKCLNQAYMWLTSRKHFLHFKQCIINTYYRQARQNDSCY